MELHNEYIGTNQTTCRNQKDIRGQNFSGISIFIYDYITNELNIYISIISLIYYLVSSYTFCVATFVWPNLTPVTMYCVIIANVRSTLLIWGNPKFDYKIHDSYIDSYIWIMFHHPSRAAYNSGLGVLCESP